MSDDPTERNWQQRADDLQTLGLSLLEESKYNDAAKPLLDSLALHEAHDDEDGGLSVATYLGVALYECGKLDHAVSIWEEILSRGWKLPTVYALLAKHYTETGQPEEVQRVSEALKQAEQHVEQAVAEAPNAAAGDAQPVPAGDPGSAAARLGALPNSTSRILVADDEEGVRSFLVRFLRGNGYDVDEAEDGEQALASIMENRPALLVLDIYMPKLSGLDVLTRMREANLDTPVIVASGFADGPLVESVIGHGAAFLAKPISLKELKKLVEAKLALHDAERALSAAGL